SVTPATHRPARSHERTPPAIRPPPAAITKAASPAPAHVTRYPAVKRRDETRVRSRVMREYSATVGATDGNIIAAIITTQTPRNQPSVPRLVHGPLSIPRIRSAVHHQPAPARTKSRAT